MPTQFEKKNKAMIRKLNTDTVLDDMYKKIENTILFILKNWTYRPLISQIRFVSLDTKSTAYPNHLTMVVGTITKLSTETLLNYVYKN